MVVHLHTDVYDKALSASLPHLQHYPTLLPHIGSQYAHARKKILLVGESHYTNNTAPIAANEWYNTSRQHGLSREVLAWVDTRANIRRIEAGDLQIFANVRKALQALSFIPPGTPVLSHIAFYNYFQRPAFVKGASVQHNGIDNDIAYTTYKALTGHIVPDATIFLSKKAFDVYSYYLKKKGDTPQNLTDFVPHPTSAHWHRAAYSYNGSSQLYTGKEKFDILLQDLDA